MRTITKGDEPASLVKHRATAHADYENYPDKDTLRSHLVREQRGLCCYCLSRIRPTADTMKIEHWHGQDEFSGEQLDYSNLLGACLGDPRQPDALQHCDTRKRNRLLTKNPANPAQRIENLVRYEGDGRIVSDDTAFNGELETVLNLNTAFLKNNRKATLDAFRLMLEKRGGGLQRITLEKWLRDWNGESQTSELQPFCMVVVYWLRKRLDRA